MIEIALHRLELAVKFAKNLENCKLKQASGNVIISSKETNDSLVFPCYGCDNDIEIDIDFDFAKKINFLKKQGVHKVIIDNDGIFINNAHININRTPKDFEHHIACHDYMFDDSVFEIIGTEAVIPTLIDCMSFASADPARLVLNGVFIDLDGSIVATNGRRLMINNRLIRDRNIKETILISYTALEQVKKIFSRTLIFYRHKTIKDLYKFSDGIFSLYTRKQEGVYPNFRLCLSTKPHNVYFCNGKTLYNEIKKNIFNDKFNSPKVNLFFNGIEKKISVEGNFKFKSDISLCQMSDNADINVKVDPRFLDFLKDKSCIKIKVVDSENPIIFEDNNCQYVIMPMRG